MAIADVSFSIGKTHDVCQDYGVADDPGQSGLSEPDAVAVVCDGCSSSPDTDMGARLLARSAIITRPFDPNAIIQRADQYRAALELDPHALDATLLMARETSESDAEVFVCGDGVVVARRRDGTGYDFWTLSFNLNAPEYLSYRLDTDRYAEYQKAGGGVLTVSGKCPPVGDCLQARVQGVHFSRVFPRAVYDVVLVMSDGAESFQKRDGTRLVPVPLTDVLDQVLDLKVLTPGFLRRRMGKFLGKFCVANGWQHYDDFAVGGLVLDPPEEDE